MSAEQYARPGTHGNGSETTAGARSSVVTPLDPRLLAWVMRRQFEINCASSVAIEFPALRPYAKALRDA